MPLSDLFGFARLTEKDDEKGGAAMGMQARKRKELEDNARAMEGTGSGPGGGNKRDDGDTYEDLFGKRHRKGSLE